MFIILLTVLKPVQEKQKHRTALSLHQRQILLPTHTVIYHKNGKYDCGGQCVRFKSYKICSHTVAVAEYNEELHKFVQYFKKGFKNRINDLID